MHLLRRLLSWPSLFVGRTSRGYLPASFLAGLKIIIDPTLINRLLQAKKVSQRKTELSIVYGPIDNILGWFSPLTMEVKIDILETALRRAKSMDPVEIDRVITNVVAHEARHVWQFRQRGWLGMRWDHLLLLIGSYWYFFGWGLDWPFDPLIAWARHLAMVGPVLGFIFVIMKVVLALNLASSIAYWFCWAERDARSFAKKVENDPAWEEVVKVEYGINVPHHLILRPDGSGYPLMMGEVRA